MSKTEQGVEIAEWSEGGDANFSIEIDTGAGGTEVFEGDTEKQLIERLAVAKAKATQTIRRLTQENKALRAVIRKLQDPRFGPMNKEQQDVFAEIRETALRLMGLRQRNS